MNYRYPRHRIQEIVDAPKCLSSNQELEVKGQRGKGSNFDVPLDLTDGPFCDLRYLGKAGRTNDPTTYDTSLLLDQRRVRGIGYNLVARRNFRRKRRIPAGWHQNICDPNMPTGHTEWNQHPALPSFNPTDFSDFIRKAAELWNIDLGWQAELL